MDEGKFWLVLWTIVAVGVVALAGCIAAVQISDSLTIERMVKAGADPTKASCSLRVQVGVICAVAK